MKTQELIFNKHFEITESKNILKNGIKLKDIWDTIIKDEDYVELKYNESKRNVFGGKTNFYKWLEDNNIIVVHQNSKIGKIALNLKRK
jgi:hypothetical protein